ncbi:Oidioi.mRNA.OKI2018_I69.chr1.g261.t1.cds [Oikopleura dioica]|uniref:Oidioi.mRNA.OKI2018_I69.chr1.g261.t1.cds n=1 Tax=Oikopleura dioica TaxID=34765 RepID=A0ABN7SNR8_OIKDI|nr:Oidioi.mRNA.OKI2018_I69.chr1.g261.t1.cds [Oikopleura dioica]
MKKLSFLFLSGVSCWWWDYDDGYTIQDNEYSESPCFDKSHRCHEEETCVPEGQHLYECCPDDWNRLNVPCRKPIEHPCFKNPCKNGEFCYRKISQGEENHDYECIEEDEECHGVVMCEKPMSGSCSGNNRQKPKRIIVKTIDDCYNMCAAADNCSGFDIDSKGGCYLAKKPCDENDLEDLPGFEEQTKEVSYREWIYDKYYGYSFTTQRHLTFTYYSIDNCKAPKRSEKCDEILKKSAQEHALEIKDILTMMASQNQQSKLEIEAGIYENHKSLMQNMQDIHENTELLKASLGLMAVLSFAVFVMMFFRLKRQCYGGPARRLSSLVSISPKPRAATALEIPANPEKLGEHHQEGTGSIPTYSNLHTTNDTDNDMAGLTVRGFSNKYKSFHN